MKKSNRIVIVILPLLFAFAIGLIAGHAITSPNENNKEIAVSASPFDVSSLEDWCGDFSDGNIRMIGAWRYADGVVEDETGMLWKVYADITPEDFLLIWIADNNTPDNPTDDMVIKIWREAY